MRTFHIGGTASGVTEQSIAVAKHEGIIKLSGMRFVIDSQGRKIVVSRKAKLAIAGKDGRELQEQSVEYGYILLVDNNQKVSVGEKLFEWDANSRILITEQAGTVKFVDVIDNVTVQDRLDEATGVVNKIILEQRGERYQPVMSILDAAGNDIVQYHLRTRWSTSKRRYYISQNAARSDKD
jgi:DNA-directed RNA polymerase subunit beta'